MEQRRAPNRVLRILLFRINLVLAVIVFTGLPGLAQSAAEGYGGTVLIGMKGDFDSFNELNASDSDALQVIPNMLFMSLTHLDNKLEFAPALAKSWQFSNGDSVLTFYLRHDVYWTDGQPTTAQDVLFTYRLATDPKVAYPAASRFDLTETVDAPDKYTVRFHFKKPYPDALYDTEIPILPEHILRQMPAGKIGESTFNRNPVGNGPFKLVQWQANQQVVFEANPRYALGRPFLDRVVFLIIPDETTLLTSLLTGEVDMVPALTPQGFKQVASHSSLKAVRSSGREFTFIGWNNAVPLFDKRIRRALTYAINKQEIIDTLLEGFALPAKGPLLPHVWAFDDSLKTYAYNPQKARHLLSQAGWKDSDGDGFLDQEGERFEFAIKTNSGSQMRKDVAVMVQAQLRKIGIIVRVESVEWNLFIEQVFERKAFDAVVLGWDTDFTVNPTDLWHSNAIDNGYNFVSYSNPKVDSLLEMGRALSRRALAEPVWHEFQQIVVDEAPYTFLYIPEALTGFNRKIRNLEIDARGFLTNVKRWQLSRENGSTSRLEE